MFKKNKTILVAISLVILAVILIVGVLGMIQKKITDLNEKEQIPTTLTQQPSQPPQSQKIPHRNKQALIEGIKKEGEKKYKTYTLFEGDTEKFIETYQDHAIGGGVDYRSTPPEQIEDYGNGGILVMEKQGDEIKYLWNSVFEMGSIGEMPSGIKVRDINNDGVKEILSYWDYLSSKYIYKSLWIFQYDKKSKKFNLISPLSKGGEIVSPEDLPQQNLSYQEIRRLSNKFSANEIKLEDLDNDKIEEVKLLYLLDERQDTPYEVAYPHTRNVRTYKWDGKTFYLWEEKTSEHTPDWNW